MSAIGPAKLTPRHDHACSVREDEAKPLVGLKQAKNKSQRYVAQQRL